MSGVSNGESGVPVRWEDADSFQVSLICHHQSNLWSCPTPATRKSPSIRELQAVDKTHWLRWEGITGKVKLLQALPKLPEQHLLCQTLLLLVDRIDAVSGPLVAIEDKWESFTHVVCRIPS